MRMIKFLILFVICFGLSSCAKKAAAPLTKIQVYKDLYKEAPVSILVMLPINKTNNVEVKDFFYTTLTTSLSDMGYYVIPPFMGQEILRSESANDTERFVEAPLQKFGEVFGADAVLFTTVTKWKKNGVTDNVEIQIEYVLKSTKTNNVLFQRKGNLVYDTSIKPPSNSGLAGLVIAAVVSKINTAATSYVKVSRMCNDVTLSDLPTGKYHARHRLDSASFAGLKEFSTKIGGN